MHNNAWTVSGWHCQQQKFILQLHQAALLHQQAN